MMIKALPDTSACFALTEISTDQTGPGQHVRVTHRTMINHIPERQARQESSAAKRQVLPAAVIVAA
ncbi:MAG: hypothetical protein HKN42_03845 [Granulosicoccus sp.]|nr:hypothetical protein [Granulosicoccus sp.]